MSGICIGTAGWAVPRMLRDRGSRLERYARSFTAVEINTSFYRPHRTATYHRWAASVPVDFQFSVKTPRTITHDSALRGCREEIARFSGEVCALGAKLSVVLVQLPPSLEFEQRVAAEFFARLRDAIPAHIVCEPRHLSWFDAGVDRRLARWGIARAGADPAPDERGASPAGDLSVVYFRLHGSPRMYYSSYDAQFLERVHGLALNHLDAGRTVWCIFDNTAEFAAWDNALELQALDRAHPGQHGPTMIPARATARSDAGVRG